jgi:ABC-type bacteriocin/lantibiotic exporter with double-glycine peptidase domain
MHYIYMSRSKTKPVKQPDEVSCGPASLKTALKIFDKKISFSKLINLCKTSNRGTSITKILQAIKKLGLSALFIKKATLKHINRTLSTGKPYVLVSLINYLYEDDDHGNPDPESGHWAVVASFSQTKKRIVLFDSYTGKRKSYAWPKFRLRWLDYDLQKRHINQPKQKFKFVRKWYHQPLIIVGCKSSHLPQYLYNSQKIAI